MIHVSIGTAGVLGLTEVPMAVPPTTAYLMVGGKCRMNCAFCAQARESRASHLALSRVIWPEVPLQEVCARLRDAEQGGHLGRCCIQVTGGQGYYRCALDVIRQIRQATSMPINAAILLTRVEQAVELIEAGVDRIGFGLDAACERVFRRVKGPHWSRMLALVEGTARRYPGQAAIHLIVGLGESEREMVERVLWASELGVEVGLFAFTPVPGTALAYRSPPPLGQYRRMQASRWLIVHCGAHKADFVFNRDGTLVGIGLDGWPRHLLDGQAFRTSGCPDCNRPFYNERPGGTMYNYPRPLTPPEAQQAMLDMEIDSR